MCGTGPTDSRGGTPGSRPLETELAVLCRMYVSNFILPVCPQAACKLLLVTSVLLLYVVGVLFNVFERLVPFPLCARGKACRFLWNCCWLVSLCRVLLAVRPLPPLERCRASAGVNRRSPESEPLRRQGRGGDISGTAPSLHTRVHCYFVVGMVDHLFVAGADRGAVRSDNLRVSHHSTRWR